MSDLPPPRYIDTPEGLTALARDLGQARWIAVDTEADSFHHYREKVCLLQISFDAHDVIVDPLAIGELEALRPVFGNPQQIKIFHDAGYDLIGLHRDFNLEICGLFDTMWASRLLGLRSFGLAAVLEQRFDFVVDKRLQRSDWARRPLSSEQIHYARLDTHFLPQLAELLQRELEGIGRGGWAAEDFARMPNTARKLADQKTGPDPELWWRIKGVKQLSPIQRGRARALWLAREKLAARLDRPPFKVFGDSVILDLARNPPTSVEALTPRKGLRRAGVERFGAQIMRAIEEASPVKGSPPAGTGRRRRPGRFLDPDARNRYDRLRELRAGKAEELGIEPEVALANAVIEEIARDPPTRPADLERLDVLRGWRGEIFNHPLAVALGFDGQPPLRQALP